MQIWTDDYLNQLAVDAEQQINQDIPVIYQRFCFAVNSGQSVYTLPSFVRGIRRITWRGRKVDPVSFAEFGMLTPATAVQSNTTKIEGSSGRPYWYTLHPTNIFDIRFYPTPNETFDATGDPYSPDFGPKCIIACNRSIDSTFADPTAVLPTYIDRRTRKAYVAWKAFESEGKGQNLKAATYYKSKYQFLITQFLHINEGCYVSKQYSLDDGQLAMDNWRYPKPMLPSNFERVRY